MKNKITVTIPLKENVFYTLFKRELSDKEIELEEGYTLIEQYQNEDGHYYMSSYKRLLK